MTEALLSVRDLGKRFGAGDAPAVDGLSFDLAPGEILALIGPSGCGKTTSLRMVAGFEAPDRGRILLRGRDVTGLAPERRGIGMVFQDYALFPHMTVAENVMFGARVKSAAANAGFLDLVGLSGFGARYPDELSGGQQQRVALARSFAAEPGLILLDEPFSNLDVALRSATRREIRRLLKDSGVGIVFVTHDQEEAMTFADRIGVMRDGRLLQIGTGQQIYDRPVDAFVAGFLGRTNLIEGRASGDYCDTPLGRLRLARPATGEVTLSLRPESLRIAAVDNPGSGNGRITGVDFKGHDMTYWISLGGIELQIDAMHGPRLPEGCEVTVTVDGPPVPLRGAAIPESLPA